MNNQAAPDVAHAEVKRNQFGTFGGVFTPSILTILGVIMFIRAGFVIGEAGIIGAIAILLICKLITFFTSLSIGAVTTNMQMRGGGAYFMISRVLGPEFGGAIGIALFFAQALSVPFYILGFTEALVLTFPGMQLYFGYLAMASAVVLFVIAYVGAGWAIKAQYFIMGVLCLAILAFCLGGIAQFDAERFATNLQSSYTHIGDSERRYNFWLVLAIYFPAVTGILAGVNMSGDLKNPGRSIPRGTMAALAVGLVVYLIQIIICGGAFDRVQLVEQPFESLKDSAIFGTSALVVAGMFAAALSSALGSYLGAPRILQAVARDRILEIIRPFAKGSAKGDEPRAGLVFTGIITVVVILAAGNNSGGGAINSVASIITMFFLYTYGMVNLAAFIEAFGHNPSFRPKFRVFHWSTALLGAIGCIGVAFLINYWAAIAAIILIGLSLWYLKKRELMTTFGDARRGFIFSSMRKNLVRLAQTPEDPKNWRPTILVFSGNPASREALVTYSVWLESGRGIVILANVLVGSLEEKAEERLQELESLRQFCRSKNIEAFPSVVFAKDRMAGFASLMQTTAIGTIRPNLVMFGWCGNPEGLGSYTRFLRMASTLGASLLLLYGRTLPKRRAKRVDIWWRGHRNGELIVILAHLLVLNWEWTSAEIRVLRLTEDEEEREETEASLQNLIDEARVDAYAKAIVSDKPFREILFKHSHDADCVFLGFVIPMEGTENSWHSFYSALLERMPTTILVHSSGGADMRA